MRPRRDIEQIRERLSSGYNDITTTTTSTFYSFLPCRQEQYMEEAAVIRRKARLKQKRKRTPSYHAAWRLCGTAGRMRCGGRAD